MRRFLAPGKFFAGVGGVLLAALVTSAAAPHSASGIPPMTNPFGGMNDLIGGPVDVASALGATMLQEALEWLLGGLKATITLGFVKYLVHVDLAVGESLSRLTGPMIVVGGFFLIVGLITSIGDGYREIVAGTDTAPRVIGQAIFRVIGLAILLGSWFWIVPLAVDVANGMSGYVLRDGATGTALRRTFAGEWLLDEGFPLLGLLTGIMLAFAILLLVVLKFVIAIAFSALYIGGPALIGVAALPRIGSLPLAIATRGLLTLTAIPLLWTVVFAAWAGVSAGTFDAASGGGGVIGGLMGPGLFLAGLIVMLAVTKKVLSMATFGLALSVPGAGVARSAATSAITRRLGAAAKGAAVAGAASRHRGEAARPAPRPQDEPGHQPERPAAWRTGEPAPTSQKRYRTLDTSPSAAHAQRDRAARQRRAGATHSVLTVDTDGAFIARRDVSHESVERVTRDIADRRARGDVSSDEARRAGEVLTAADRSAFAVAAEAAQKEDPARARRHFERAMSVQIAAAPALDNREREAAITVASASPEVVQRAFASDYQSFGSEPEPDTHGYDRRLMDQQGGLEAYRREFEGKPSGPRDRSEGDEERPS